MINLFQPDAGRLELDAITEVFSSNWLGAGERVKQFEEAFGRYVGRPAEEMITVASCTEGIFHALAALRLRPTDEVVLPTISFIGAAHAVQATGARIVLCDVDPRTLNPTVGHIEAALTPATRAAVILHYGGEPGAVRDISQLAIEHTFTLIEDAAVGLGSTQDGRSCGTFGDIGVWSFDSMKILTTGDGGMIRCRDEAIRGLIRRSTRLGIGSSGFDRRLDSSRWWELDPPEPGRRANMNDIAAAMGLVQLRRLPAFLEDRRAIAARYDQGLTDVPWITPPPTLEASTARIFYWIQTAPEVRDRLAFHLLERDIYTNYQYWPLHRTRLYRSAGPFPGADHAAASTLLLPLHQRLSEADTDRTLAAIRAFSP